ncbi:MAG: hypothetical protein NTW19_05465 [Planctomycetota bacterium]|nr:hypothetical protein [Planctomycetota bacterium]
MLRLINQKRVLILLAGLLLVSSFLPSRLAFPLAAGPAHTLILFLAPPSDVLKRIGDRVRRPPLDAAHEDAAQVRRDRDKLLQYSRRLEQEVFEARQAIDQLTRMSRNPELAGIKFIPASVTAWPPGGAPALELNRGSRDGLEPGMVVVSDMNLVGTLAQVGPMSATVRLVNTPGSVVGVRIVPPVAGPAGPGVVARATVSPNGQEFWAESVDADKVKPGDLAHLDDKLLPPEARAFVVGRVSRIEPLPQDPLLRRRVVFSPIESLVHLGQVFVIMPVRAQGNPLAPNR